MNVLYYHSEFDGYAGRPYTYETDLDLHVGSKVIAPTVKNPMQRAIVNAINLPNPTFQCRKIELLDTEASGDGNEG